MNKKYLSGAQKRKNKIEEQERLKKLPKLTSFVTVTSKFPSSSASTSSPPDDVIVASDIVENESQMDVPQSTVTATATAVDDDSMSICESFSESVERKEFEADPALWDINRKKDVDYWIQKGPSMCQNIDSDFSKSQRIYEHKDENGMVVSRYRYVSKDVFHRVLRNGETVKREWLLYSPSTYRVYCFVCRLLSKKESTFSHFGFNDWKHLDAINKHENSDEHRKCYSSYIVRQKSVGCVDAVLDSQFHSERNYWRQVLKRIVAVIRFLASRGLAFRGDDEKIGSKKNGNYLGCLELIAEFDPFLKQHLDKYGNAGSGTTSYLSSTICDEFIELIAARVLSVIKDEIKRSKYYSISVDSTPDVAHIDQLTFTVRYVHKSEPIERFLAFIPIYSHGAKNLSETIIEFLSSNSISLANCRGQSYDNAANMSGIYTGVQARICEVNELACFVPCAGHSLNLVGVKAAECCQNSILFFDFVQRLYSFFAASTHRWHVLTTSLGDKLVVKRLSDTRWSSRHDATRALNVGFSNIVSALEVITNDETQDEVVKCEAVGLINKMERLENVFMTILWNDILGRMNGVSKELQSSTIDILYASNLLSSLEGYFIEIREMFDMYESKAKEMCPNAHFNDFENRIRKRSDRLKRFEGGSEEVILSGSNKFKLETFLPIIDSLFTNVSDRCKKYQKIGCLFSFLGNLSDLDKSEMETKCKKLAEVYKDDIVDNELFHECIHWNQLVNGEKMNIREMYTKIINENLKSCFPNLEIIMRINLCMMITNCTGERSFSKLKLIKNVLRSQIGQTRLNSMSLLSIESDIMDEIDFDELIDEFCLTKCRKRAF